MQEYSFNYIITIHNKENLIKEVVEAIIKVAGKKSTIYPVLDGCTDNSESIIKELADSTNIPIKLLYAQDVHEILSINTALNTIPQNGKGFNILLQDDVILRDINFEQKIIDIYELLGYYTIGVLAFRHAVDVRLNAKTKEIEEFNHIESEFGSKLAKRTLSEGYLVERMVGVRSPECISFDTIARVGIMDAKLAPYTYDNHDFSLRCLLKGYKNYLYSIDFLSDEKWGGMRVNPHPNVRQIMARNRQYLYNKFNSIFGTIDKRRFDKVRPFTFSIETNTSYKISSNLKKNSPNGMIEQISKKMKSYYELLELKFQSFINSFSKDPLKYLDNWEHSLENSRKYYLCCHYYFQHYLPKPLKEHKAYFKRERRGFGEDAFHVMWFLLYQKFKFRNFLEIGVYRGQVMSLISLLANEKSQNIEIQGISPLNKSGDQVSKYLELDYEADIYMNFTNFGLQKPKLLNAYSTDIESVNLIKSKQWDCIYIDGSHDFEIVLRDWEVCSSSIIDGGIIILDDASLYTDYRNPFFSFKGHHGPSKVANNIDRDAFREILRVGHNRVFQKI